MNPVDPIKGRHNLLIAGFDDRNSSFENFEETKNIRSDLTEVIKFYELACICNHVRSRIFVLKVRFLSPVDSDRNVWETHMYAHVLKVEHT